MELQLKDLETVEKKLDKVKKASRTGDKVALKELDLLNKVKENLESAISVRAIEIPSLYFAHDRKVVWRNGSWIPVSEYLIMQEEEEVVTKKVRFRTLGDITITGGIESDADTLEKIVEETLHLPCYCHS